MEETESGIIISVKDSHSEKTHFPIEEIAFDILMLSNSLQLQNALFSMVRTEFGMLKRLILLFDINASAPIILTLSEGMVTMTLSHCSNHPLLPDKKLKLG